MKPAHRFRWPAISVALSVALAAGLLSIGCGSPGAPQPPSLLLPDPVTDLSASRAGDQVSLTWTMPRRNTDKLLLKDNVQVNICREEGLVACAPVPGSLSLAPGADGSLTESLPAALAAGPTPPTTSQH